MEGERGEREGEGREGGMRGRGGRKGKGRDGKIQGDIHVHVCTVRHSIPHTCTCTLYLATPYCITYTLYYVYIVLCRYSSCIHLLLLYTFLFSSPSFWYSDFKSSLNSSSPYPLLSVISNTSHPAANAASLATL